MKPTGVEAFAIVSKVDDEVMVFDHEFEGKRYQFFAIAKTIEAAKEAAWDSPQRNDTRIEPVVISIKHNKPRKKSSGRKTSKA